MTKYMNKETDCQIEPEMGIRSQSSHITEIAEDVMTEMRRITIRQITRN